MATEMATETCEIIKNSNKQKQPGKTLKPMENNLSNNNCYKRQRKKVGSMITATKVKALEEFGVKMATNPHTENLKIGQNNRIKNIIDRKEM